MKFRHLSGAARILAGFFVGVTLYANFGPTPEPEYRDVIVPVKEIVRAEPDTLVKWRERVVYRTVQRETRATAPGGAASDVEAFCAVGPSPVPADSAPPNQPEPDRVPALVRSATYDGRTLKLWEVQADGDLALESFRVRSPWQFTMQNGEAFVQSSRWWWVDDAAKAAALLGVGYAVGRF